MDPRVFISYSSKDQKVARTICTALGHRGVTCWISFRDVQPGQNFQEQIVKAIRASKIMVLVFTSNANNSNQIKKELALASQTIWSSFRFASRTSRRMRRSPMNSPRGSGSISSTTGKIRLRIWSS